MWNGVAAETARDNGSVGYSVNGGAGASLAVRSGERGRPVRLPRARGRGGRHSGYVNGDAKAFAPLGDWGSEILIGPGGVPAIPPAGTGSTSGGSGFDWSQVFGVITQAAPAIISAARGSGVPAGYYPSAVQGQQQQFSQIPPGYQYVNGQLVDTRSLANAGAQAGAGLANLSNSISTFVTANPMVVLGGAVALLLLFKSPPSRR